MLSCAFAAPSDPTAPLDRPVGVEQPLEAVIPLDLRAMLLAHPHVRFVVTVSADGELVDYIATFATHHGLLERAEQRLERAKFSAAVSDGSPVQESAGVFVTFFDPEQRAIQSGLIALPAGNTPLDAAVRWMSETAKADLQYKASRPDDLDRPLEIQAARVLVMTDAEGRPASGECLLEFYINDHGKVRLPRVVKSDNETVSMSALLTVRETQYAPITRNGHPTYVKVRQPMAFNPPQEGPATR